MCTGSFGSSHQPCTSPECALFGLWIRPSAQVRFQFDVVLTDGSLPADTGDVGKEYEPDGMTIRGRPAPLVCTALVWYDEKPGAEDDVAWESGRCVASLSTLSSGSESCCSKRCSTSNSGKRFRMYRSKFGAVLLWLAEGPWPFALMIIDATSLVS
jgi:hypothetical protein